jgi:hypothetical protein
MLLSPQDERITVKRIIFVRISSLIGIIFCIVISDISFLNPNSPGYAAIEIASISLTFIVYFDSY